MKNRNNIITTTTFLALGLFALSPIAHALNPPPDGGYPNGNTAEGQGALSGPGMISGYNTAIGFYSLASLTDGGFNTGVGAGALLASRGEENTATGVGALLSNTTGNFNTANGTFALFSNTTAISTTGIGHGALFSNTTGNYNTALGDSALYSNTIATDNTAIGSGALYLCTGASNVAIGAAAGQNLTTGSNNVYIGAGIEGIASDDGACRIGSIYGATITNGTQVFINSDNRLGTITSSKRFKQNITPTSKASEVLYELRPIKFQYKKEIDPEGRWQFGLVAEEVKKVNPDLVVSDKEGKPYSVRYDQVNAMLLNEFLKEHRTVEEQKATIGRLEKEVQALAAGLERVTSELERTQSAPRLAGTGQ